MTENGPKATKLLQAMQKTINATIEHFSLENKNDHKEIGNNSEKNKDFKSNVNDIINNDAKCNLDEKKINLTLENNENINNLENENQNNNILLNTDLNDSKEKVYSEILKIYEGYINEELICKLNDLDEKIMQNRINLRSIKCEKYVKEIFESYIVDKKINLNDFFDKKMLEENEKRNLLRKEVEKLKKETEKMDKDLKMKEEKYDKLISLVNN
ncbi:hypothetical protein GVAV_000402 [Gurleya vavrai]